MIRFKHRIDQLVDLVLESRAEEERLAIFFLQSAQFFRAKIARPPIYLRKAFHACNVDHVALEVLIEQTVCFVKYEPFNLGRIDLQSA